MAVDVLLSGLLIGRSTCDFGKLLFRAILIAFAVHDLARVHCKTQSHKSYLYELLRSALVQYGKP